MGRILFGVLVNLLLPVGWRFLVLNDVRRNGTNVWLWNPQHQDLEESTSYRGLGKDATALLPCFLLSPNLNYAPRGLPPV